MGKCLRRSGRQQQQRRRRRMTAVGAAAVEEAAAPYLTLRSGRRVPAAVVTGGSPGSRRRHRRGGRCCGKAGAGAAARQRLRRVVAEQGWLEEKAAELPLRPTSLESPVAVDVVCDDGCGGDRSFDRHATLISGEAKRNYHDNDDGGAVAGWPPSSSPPEAEVEAFFAAAELAERQRFAETYNYDVALDRPLEGRFEWSPAAST